MTELQASFRPLRRELRSGFAWAFEFDMLIVSIGQIPRDTGQRARIQLRATPNIITGLFQIDKRGFCLVAFLFLMVLIVVLFFLMLIMFVA